jgi:hypothetical protein
MRQAAKAQTATANAVLEIEMKTNSLFAFTILVAATVPFASSTLVRTQTPIRGRNLSSLTGTYALASHGFNISSGVAIPKALLETIQFNGDGTVVAPFATLSVNGTILRFTNVGGTYAVNADGTGSLTFTTGATYDLVLGRGEKEIYLIQTTDPSGAGTVFEATAIKVAP